ncbi:MULTISPECIES: Crp/Fnr family transcriptional regulator [Mucilaginibacter]|uniref:Crp/Fnr family transcriptional regulator n=1 Tax=Mucilaginibacter TaxID=423349 RepID=UPI00087185C6|nr:MULTISPECIES: Crp/Fnr family transcriptional regulator [Mucilaginibacter]NVM64801.1 CRP-like cAMP-binding protein [Mucilaginibacter sp. SG538B]QTE35749.1 Crp/Fnr family transcriptional regulator [Mucilaginibacter gossypii]RAV56892.1 Crp/Fnr family transcriptional regulator [Mucilaginibacter rubeus]WDZ98763.1 Crp/Fnr family transcriptional regulator [Mucilaginibacter sp. SJ]SCW82726.1 cAMP-binding domain of CRP or a regulatory subunit of cAMP-dependent protein kinases [Mucilaginibacter sp. N
MADKQQVLNELLGNFAGMSENDVAVSLPYWRTRKIEKGDFFNMQNIVCTDLALINKGLFRIYYVHPETQEEKNIYFFSERQFLVSFRSFINQYPCAYYIQAMEDAEIISINYNDLQYLYSTPTGWQRFGRLVAELFFNQSQARTEEFLFNTAEERYLKMITQHPNIVSRIPAYHISSYLGIKNPSLTRIKKRLSQQKP